MLSLEDRLDRIIDALEKIRLKSKLFPHRTDPGSILQSKVDYGYHCRICGEKIELGEKIVAFKASPDAKGSTYIHASCDDWGK